MIERKADCLVVSGPMTMQTAMALRAAGLAALSEPVTGVDLSGVGAVDSSALAVLLAWQRRCGRRLAQVGVPEALRSLANLYRLDELLDPPA